jgi:hypothetical protein
MPNRIDGAALSHFGDRVSGRSDAGLIANRALDAQELLRGLKRFVQSKGVLAASPIQRANPQPASGAESDDHTWRKCLEILDRR